MSLAECLQKLPHFTESERREIVAGGGRDYVKAKMDGAIADRNEIRSIIRDYVDGPAVSFSPSRVTEAWLKLTENDEAFSYPKSESKNIEEIAATIAPDFSLTEADVGDEFSHAWLVFKGEARSGKPDAWLMHYADGKVEVNVAPLGEGNDGSALYSVAGTYAHNNGLVFAGDRRGISPKGIERRLENMISLALKYRSTDFLLPHPAMKLDWKVGDFERNVEEMLNKSYDNAIKQWPWIKDYYYDFDTATFRDNGGNAVALTDAGENDFTEGVSFAADTGSGRDYQGREQKSGTRYRTQKRAIFTHSVLRAAGGEGRGDILEALSPVQSSRVVQDYKGVAYSTVRNGLSEEFYGNRTIDGANLTTLRRAAADLERPKDGVFLYVTEDGRAIATGPKGVRIPETFRRFANDNDLAFYAERRIPKAPGAEEGNNASNTPGGITSKSEPMPIAYRESGARYFGEDVGEALDRTSGTRFSPVRDRENIDTAARRMGKFVDAYEAGQVGPMDTQLIGPTPVVLQALGAENLNVQIDGATLKKVIRGKHSATMIADLVRGIPEGLYDPLAVFDSPDPKTKEPGRLLLTEATDRRGSPVVIAVHLWKDGGRFKVNEIASAYGLDDFPMRAKVSPEKLQYVRNETGLDSSTTPVRLKLAGVVQKSRDLGNNILSEDDLVNLYGPRFSRHRSAVTNQPIQQAWKAPDNLVKWDNFVRTMQDKLVDTKRVVAEIRKAGVAIKDSIDPYLQEILYHGRAAKRVSDFADNELHPLLVELSARGIDRQEFEDYLWARHAKERNAQIATVNPAMPDGGSGLTDQQSKDILAGREVTVDGRKIKLNMTRNAGYQSLAKKIDAITTETTDTLVRYGLETQETVDAWRKTYRNYVPLMRDMTSDDNYAGAFNLGLGTGQGFSVRGSAAKRALGSDRAVTDILANVAMQRERAIVRGEKNRVAQALYGLTLAAPNPDFWLTINPDAGKDPKTVASELIKLGLNPLDAENIAHEPKQQYVDPRTGMVAERVNPQLRNRSDVLAVRIDGKDRYVMFSSDERAQRMVAGLKNLDAEHLGVVLQNVAVVTRWFSSINTQYNPVFGLTNGIRDLGTGMLNLASTDLKGHRTEVLKNAFSALRGVYVDLRDHRAGRRPSSSWALEFEEFAAEGGQTGYRDMFQTSQARTEALAKELKDAGKGKSWLALGENRSPLFGWLSDYNTAIENAVRLSAYKAGKDKGLTRQQAAALAKGLTVNFNKKGTAATQMGAMYAFFNAAVQGTARIGETMVKVENGKATLTAAGKHIAYGGVLLGVLQAAMFAVAGFDDDEPPQFAREKNFILPLPGGKYLSVPYPMGYHILPGLGRIAGEFALSGFKKPGQRLVDLSTMLVDGFNPIGNTGGSLTQMLSPTIADPIVALNENKDWTGKPIFREDFNKMHPTAGWTRTKDTASSFSKFAAYAVNYITGGGKYEIGLASPTPDQLDYLIGQATGGVGREALKAWQFGTTVASGEELPMHKIPVAGRFAG